MGMVFIVVVVLVDLESATGWLSTQLQRWERCWLVLEHDKSPQRRQDLEPCPLARGRGLTILFYATTTPSYTSTNPKKHRADTAALPLCRTVLVIEETADMPSASLSGARCVVRASNGCETTGPSVAFQNRHKGNTNTQRTHQDSGPARLTKTRTKSQLGQM